VIWHETYAIQDGAKVTGAYENIYINMPAFGLGKAGILKKHKASTAPPAGV